MGSVPEEPRAKSVRVDKMVPKAKGTGPKGTKGKGGIKKSPLPGAPKP